MVRYYYSHEPKRGVDALNLRMLSWLRRAPPGERGVAARREAPRLREVVGELPVEGGPTVSETRAHPPPSPPSTKERVAAVAVLTCATMVWA